MQHPTHRLLWRRQQLQNSKYNFLQIEKSHHIKHKSDRDMSDY